jgi:2-phospho-L-lactate/phosphoenolpyruvate guanylyltransferase
VKRFSEAKQRLGASVGEQRRLELAPAMVADVLVALSERELVHRTIVVTNEEPAASAARALGAIAIEDTAESGQSAAALIGVQRALAEGFQRVLCVPGDCPALDPAELDALLAPSPGAPSSAERPEVVIVPDRHGTGTNGLLITPPDAIAPSFGPGSFERHRTLALAAGANLRIERPPSLLLDIDTGSDLSALQDRLSGDPLRAPRTRAALGQPARTDVFSIPSPR